MTKGYTKDQFWKLYEHLPQELKDVLFAEETGNRIYETCKLNGVTDKLNQIVEITGRVLLGLLTAEEFTKTLQKETNIGKDTAEKVGREINRFIFYPVRPVLEQLHEAPKSNKQPVVNKETTTESVEETPSRPTSEDPYRESFEEEE